MKKLLSIVVLLALTACGNQASSTNSDIAYIKDKGTLVIGMTDFAPMDYRDENGEWIGFDADLGRIVAEDLGVEVEFVEIDWDNKILEVQNKSIDVIWNGMTLTDEVMNALSCTKPYANNAPVVVVPKEKAANYQTIDDLKDLNFAVEAGSSGEGAAIDNGLSYRSVNKQADTLLEVAAGTSDASIIDLLMAGAMIGPGTSYENLAMTVQFESEQYGVACRKDSDLVAFINDEFKKLQDNGQLLEIATKYGVQEALVKQ